MLGCNCTYYTSVAIMTCLWASQSYLCVVRELGSHSELLLDAVVLTCIFYSCQNNPIIREHLYISTQRNFKTTVKLEKMQKAVSHSN